jgi:hypothetical protein
MKRGKDHADHYEKILAVVYGLGGYRNWSLAVKYWPGATSEEMADEFIPEEIMTEAREIVRVCNAICPPPPKKLAVVRESGNVSYLGKR